MLEPTSFRAGLRHKLSKLQLRALCYPKGPQKDEKGEKEKKKKKKERKKEKTQKWEFDVDYD